MAEARAPGQRRFRVPSLNWRTRRERAARPTNAGECRSWLLPDDFVVAAPGSFANHPSWRDLDGPSVSGKRSVVAALRRGHTTGAAITGDEHALLRFECAPGP